MNEYVDYYFHELTKHGTNEFPLAIYNDTYSIFKDRFFYMHCHLELEAIIAIKGEISVMVNQTEFIRKHNNIILILPNTLHHILHYKNKDSLVLTIVFNRSILEITKSLDLINEINSIIDNSLGFYLIESKELWNKAIDISIDYKNKAFGYKLFTINYLFELFSYIKRNIDIYQLNDNSFKDNSKIKNALQYIYSHYSEEITLNDLALITHLSLAELSRSFKKTIGISPMLYIMNYRIRIASNLLEFSDKSITEIAYECGFSSSNYFTICFKRIVGITPKEFKKQKMRHINN